MIYSESWISIAKFQWVWLYYGFEIKYSLTPYGKGPREAKVRILDIGPLHNYLGKKRK
jgi:hypothetical protein